MSRFRPEMSSPPFCIIKKFLRNLHYRCHLASWILNNLGYGPEEERIVTLSLEKLSDEDKSHRAEVHLSEVRQDSHVMGWTREQVAMDVLNHYPQHVQFVQSIR